MSETQLLRQNAIVRHATTGVTPPHGPVKTGELPLVQVKMAPGGPQVQEGQQKPVTILPSKDPQGAVATGGLPMVQVKMTQNGPQPDDGRDNPVLIKNNRQTVAAGNLPMVTVKMENGRPQVQTAPNVQAGPPQIPASAPALSAPRMQQLQAGARVTRVAAPQRAIAAAPQVALPPVPELSTEQLMLFRHLVEQYLTALRAADGEEADSVKFAAAAAATLDDILVATAVHAEAAAIAAAAPVATPPPVANVYVAPRPVTGGHFSPASLAPSPPRATGYVAQGYVAQVPGTRSHVAGVRSQGHASMAPRRVQRTAQAGAAPLPPVIVKMNGNQPMVQQTPPPTVQDVPEASIAAPEAPIVATDSSNDTQV